MKLTKKYLNCHFVILPEMPDEAAVSGRRDNMTRGDCNEQGLDVDVLAVHGRADGVAQDEAVGVDIVVVLGGQDAVLPARRHGEDALHVLLVLIVRADVPETDGGVLNNIKLFTRQKSKERLYI